MEFDPAIILTAAGATVAAGAITGLIELGKQLVPGLAEASARMKQQLAALLALGAVVYAAWATGYALTPISVGGLAVAWYGITKIATATYDTARTAVQVVSAKVGSPTAESGIER